MSKRLSKQIRDLLKNPKSYSELVETLASLAEIPPIEINSRTLRETSLRRLDQGKVLFEKVQLQIPSRLESLLNYASYLSFDLSKSLKVYGKILEIDPTNLTAHRILGIGLQKSRLYEAALMLFDEGLRINSPPYLHRYLHSDISRLAESAKGSKNPSIKKLYENTIPLELIYKLNQNDFLFQGSRVNAVHLHSLLGNLEKIEGVFHSHSNCPYNRI